ncbi:IclR family transcriptional regulator [Planomonospora parontospora]|uniref:IclR family transcriptional regulator n=1 Tax=Planomonospora parontospora TaxID=58119 RepID=UPI00360B072D
MTALTPEPEPTAPARRDLPPSMVERMTLIMDAFTGRSTRLTLEDVARRTHLPRSTAHRILDQLVRLGWIEHTSSGYGLGPRALGLGGGDGHGEVREAAAPLLHDLQLRTGLVVHLAVLDGAEVFYLDKVGGRFAASVPSRVGGRAPAHSTALGKAMLAWLEPEEVDVRIGAIGRLTGRTIGEIGILHQELNRVRQRRGLAFERGGVLPRHRLHGGGDPRPRGAGGGDLPGGGRADPAGEGRPAGGLRRAAGLGGALPGCGGSSAGPADGGGPGPDVVRGDREPAPGHRSGGRLVLTPPRAERRRGAGRSGRSSPVAGGVCSRHAAGEESRRPASPDRLPRAGGAEPGRPFPTGPRRAGPHLPRDRW